MESPPRSPLPAPWTPGDPRDPAARLPAAFAPAAPPETRARVIAPETQTMPGSHSPTENGATQSSDLAPRDAQDKAPRVTVASGLPNLLSVRAESSADLHTDFDVLFAAWKKSGDPQLRDRLILSQRNLVNYLARRFMDRGEMFEDVIQVGMVGLINALDGFDPSRGVRFSTFAIPTISGEIRRYFRDKVGSMRVPRRMQELYIAIQGRIEELTQKLDRSPTYSEIAFSLQIEVEEVVETLELGNALDPQSLDETIYGDDEATLSDTIGAPDPDMHAYEEHAALQMAMSRLSEKERRVLEMAYFDGFSQADIARRMGVSQMHISRLLRRALAELRQLLEEV